VATGGARRLEDPTLPRQKIGQCPWIRDQVARILSGKMKIDQSDMSDT
jgi:hypothetical protein